MVVETCVNCDGRVDWGPAFTRHDFEARGKQRVCYYCKEKFDVVAPKKEFDLAGFLRGSEKTRP